jgi:YidC/Oxa1 family membrane protein insertase
VIVAGLTTPIVNILAKIIDWLGPHGAVGLPWAWAIVGLTVIVRFCLVPLTVKQIHSMQNLQRHAPEMKEIQRKYKHDRQKLNEELMKFYRENKINPASSCLPMVFQIPVFIGLYFTLRTLSKQATKCVGAGTCLQVLGDHNPNFHWLGLVDITAKGTAGWGPLLLVIYAASQTLSTLLMSTTMDKAQRMILLVMPVAFLAFVANFKTGLILYWVTTNLWTVGQGIVTRQLMPKTPVPQKKSSRTPPRDDGSAGDGAKRQPAQPKPQAPARAPQARQVRRKKKRTRR